MIQAGRNGRGRLTPALVTGPSRVRSRRARGGAALVATIGVLLFSTPTFAATTTRVTLRTDDGLSIAGTLNEPAARPAPAVLLLHMLSRTRHDWDAIAETLAARGLVTLAIDLRGHGESDAAPVDDLAPALRDVRAALRYLEERPDLVSPRIAILGASVGANLAVLAAAPDTTVRAIALLSPGLDYRNLRTEQSLRKYGSRPALIVASQEDPYAARSARVLAATGPGTRDVRIVDGAGHGSVMLHRRPDLAASVVDWVVQALL